jgi:2,5-dihydroxypyridine 5,6-dioxygenase
MSSLRMNHMVDLFRRELELCGVHEGETVAVLTEMGVLADYAAAFMAAAQSLGARPFNVNLLPAAGPSVGQRASDTGNNPLAGNQAALDALAHADMLVDLMFLLFSKEQIAIQKAGTRVLLVVEPFEVLARLLPTRELRERVEAALTRLQKARRLRFTNPAGTDVSYDLGQYPALCEYGFTDTPGRWDHWPSGFVFTGGDDGSVSGTVVMAPGDIMYPFKTYVREPITFTIRSGSIVQIDGGLDAKLIRDHMASFGDPRAYAISHIGWGLNQHAQWISEAMGVGGIGMEGRSFYGNVLFSTGPNTELGGSNDTRCHLDLPMKGCSLTLDDEPIVKDGEVVPQDMRAPDR